MNNCSSKTTNSIMFQNQLASIMDLLVKAAVEDINKLFEDRCAFLRLEVSCQQKENAALRRKLQRVEGELRAARRHAKDTKGSPHPAGKDGQSSDVEENWPRFLCIKEERLKEDLEDTIQQRKSGISHEEESRVFVAGEKGVLSERESSSEETQQLTEQHPTRLHEEHINRLMTTCKSEGEYEYLAQCFDQKRCLHSTPKELYPPESIQEARNNSGSGYTSTVEQMEDQSVLMGFSWAQTSEDSGTVSAFDLPSMKSEVVTAECATIKEEHEMFSACSDEARIEVVSLQPVWYEGDRGRDKMEPENNGQELKKIPAVQHHRYPGKHMQLTGNCNANKFNFSLACERECSLCNEGLTSFKNTKSNQRPQTGERRFNCTHCGKSFTQRGHLKIHQLIHTGEKPFSCTQCGKRFTHVHVLKRHLSIHTGHRPYSCSHCGKSFSLKDSLRRHKRIHTGEKPYICMYCEKRFTQGSHLKIHQLIHTGEKPFSCTQCNKSFTQLHVLKRHLSVHTGEKPYICMQCGKKFTLQDSLRRHFRIHSEENLRFSATVKQ